MGKTKGDRIDDRTREKRQARLERIRRSLVPLAGFGALVWFLIRVIPKPSRARYPCMRAAAPLASSFVIGLMGFFGSVAFFGKARAALSRSRWTAFGLCLCAALALASAYLATVAQPASAAADIATRAPAARPANDGPNMPMGTGVGIYPGRVVWAHDPNATNERYKPGFFGAWYDKSNTNQAVIDAMLADSLMALTGEKTAKGAWDALFRYHNERSGRGDVPYAKGEKIVIKINLNGTGNGPKNINTAPQLCHAILDQLTRVVGVSEDLIWIGDPNIDPDPKMYASVLADFPRVNFWGSSPGRVRPESSAAPVIFASDGGMQDPLPQAYLDAAYLINVPVLKKHHRAGISLTAKNHFGSITPFNSNGAFNWHYSLPVPNGLADNSNGAYGAYRCLVDFMGHRDLGGKTILYVVDGIWGSTNWGHPAIKWRMAPFNGDWPSSLFLSQDPVAIDSVGYDFLAAEFDRAHPTEGGYDPRDDSGPFPQYAGVDDYLHQAADQANWPKGFAYDPERDGTPLKSLGAHEHWDNAKDKRYSRNLGGTAGIELIKAR